MIPTPELHKADIYNMPVGQHVGMAKWDLILVYAPLANKYILLKPLELGLIEKHLVVGSTLPENLSEVLSDLMAQERVEGYECPSRKMGALTKLSVLPTYACNFSCSYCYAASGRSDKILDREAAKKTLDYFINPKRLQERRLFLSVLGGGEPFLAWDLCTYIIPYARHLADKHGFKLGIGLTTNGSIINDDIVKLLKENNVQASVSFEIIEEVQNKQRQNYGTVCRTIDMLCNAGISLTVKSIITPLNVSLLPLMVAELCQKLPLVKSLKLQPAEDSALFKNKEALQSFFNNFTEAFFEALPIAEKHGLDLHCPAFRNMDYIMEHYCGGELCLTPEGTVSICHRVSAPQEKHYRHFVYGHTNNTALCFDENAFDRLMAHDMHHQEKCWHCFSKWHCGGGCLATACTYEDDRLEAVCEWTKEFMAKVLLYRMDKFLYADSGQTLTETLTEALKNEALPYASYAYHFKKELPMPNDKMARKIQYLIKAFRLDNGKPIDYLLNFYEFAGYMFITDIFPADWENEKHCFERLTSKEGIFVNMKKLSVTSLIIFIKEFLPLFKDAAMVISGSYEPGEDKSAVSRKLKLYKKIFSPMFESSKLKCTDIPELNAFVISSKSEGHNDTLIKQDYYRFKNYQPD